MKELAYQHVHFIWSFISCYIAYRLKIQYYYLVGLAIGIYIELIQLWSGESWKIGDRILDLSFWALGCAAFWMYRRKNDE